MKNFKDVQIGDVLESWCAGNRESCCVIAKKTENKITTLKIVDSYGDNVMSVETINDEDNAKYYELADHYNLTLE